MDALPDEVLLLILVKLPRPDLVSTVGVDRRLRCLARDRHLWRGWHASTRVMASWSSATMAAYGPLVAGVIESPHDAPCHAVRSIRRLVRRRAVLAFLAVNTDTLVAVAPWKAVRDAVREVVLNDDTFTASSKRIMRRWRLHKLERLTIVHDDGWTGDCYFRRTCTIIRAAATSSSAPLALTYHPPGGLVAASAVSAILQVAPSIARLDVTLDGCHFVSDAAVEQLAATLSSAPSLRTVTLRLVGYGSSMVARKLEAAIPGIRFG